MDVDHYNYNMMQTPSITLFIGHLSTDCSSSWHSTSSVKALKQSQSLNPYQWSGLTFSLSTTAVPLCLLSNANITILQTATQQKFRQANSAGMSTKTEKYNTKLMK